MKPEELHEQWQEPAEEAMAAVAQWRVTHPKATLAEIEQVVDEQMNRLRARMIEQAAQASSTAESEASQGLVCQQCGQPLQARGKARRTWQTQGGQQVEVERTYVTCPQCGGGFFPLDQELQVPEGHLLPHAQEVLVRLGSELPFGRTVKHLQEMLGVRVHASTARRHTLAVGQRVLETENEQAKPLADCPEEPAAERMAMSSDGATVPLVGGVWAEVKLVAIGEVERCKRKDEEAIVTSKLTYFARMAPVATCADQASAEVRRRGIERAKQVCAIQDGAEWIQGFVSSHRHDALRILDFAHAAGYVSEIAGTVREAGGHLPLKWVDGVLHRLKHDGPERVLRHLSRFVKRYPQIQEQVTYLQKRRHLMDYPAYHQHGWPIGSGSVESGHKLVMQARLKGPGMHWRPEHVNPMLAVRLALLNERWTESWQEQLQLRQRQYLLKRKLHQQQRFLAQQAKRQQADPPASSAPPAVKPPRQKTGRTAAQYRWGRQTISPRMLKQANDAKK